MNSTLDVKETRAGEENQSRVTIKRLLVFIMAVVFCAVASMLVIVASRGSSGHSSDYVTAHPMGSSVLTVRAGDTVEQNFRCMGDLNGIVDKVYLTTGVSQRPLRNLQVRIFSGETGEELSSGTILDPVAPISGDAQIHQGGVPIPLDKPAEFRSHQDYRITVTNLDEEHPLYLRYFNGASSGHMFLSGEQVEGFLNLGFYRDPVFEIRWPVVMSLLVMGNLVVLLGLALVLFRNVRVKVLYLLLALGFGVIMLFDLGPMYGFDMYFQFDSAYVLSNRMLGIEPVVEKPSHKQEGMMDLYYYRRACDDYTQMGLYKNNKLYNNYTDNAVGLTQWKASQEDQELELVKTYQNMVGEQSYLYLPQALGFTLARLLGLGVFPMLLFARVLVYGLFVLLMYRAIADIPFGKRVLLIIGLTPTVMIQTISINRDGIILALSFYLIAKVLQAAYGDRKPRAWDWIAIVGVSALLAPCKMVYLPLSFFWLLVIWKRHEPGKWQKTLLQVFLISAVVLGFFILDNLAQLQNLARPTKVGLYGVESYTLTSILQNPLKSLYVFLNTYRYELGTYLTNAIQLFDIDAGSSDTVTILVLLVLILAASENTGKISFPERIFCLLVFIGVLLLTTLASMQWTPSNLNYVIGLQGRYLTPVLPLLCYFFLDNRMIRTAPGRTEHLVDGICCIYPAIGLMNMYIWTITR